MNDLIGENRTTWESMFDWVNSRGGRKYPNETVVIWLLSHGRTNHPEQRILDLGCGWAQSLPLFVNERFEYWGIDVTDRGFLSNELAQANGLKGRVNFEIFAPPYLRFPDGFFSHIVSSEALHLNPDPASLQPMIAECHRVMKPGGRMLSTMIRPEYWFISRGYTDRIGPHTIEVNQRHPEVARRGARYFLFETEEQIRTYFAAFSRVWIGRELRKFGEDAEKVTDYWIVSAIK